MQTFIKLHKLAVKRNFEPPGALKFGSDIVKFIKKMYIL